MSKVGKYVVIATGDWAEENVVHGTIKEVLSDLKHIRSDPDTFPPRRRFPKVLDLRDDTVVVADMKGGKVWLGGKDRSF